jgi:formate hydrogenlyase subunit 3/multisubunit Na+/H+ antiporter MnhD subunit
VRLVLLLAAILFPLTAIPAAAVVKSWKRGAALASSSLLASAVALALSAGRWLKEAYIVEPTLGLIVLDGRGYNVAFSLLACLVCAAALLAAPRFLERARRRRSPASFYALYLAASASLVATPLSGTLTTFFAFFEAYLIASWLLLLLWGGDRRRGSAALTYLVFTEVGALLTLLGIAVLYDAYGTTSFEGLRSVLQRAHPAELVLPFALLGVGPLVKMAIVPLHAWLPAAYSSAPIPLLVTMTIAEGIGGWALATLLSFTAPSVLSVAWFRLPLLALAAFTAVYGSLAALAQRDPRRLLAYSSVSQGGYLLLGIACGGDIAAASALLLFAAHSLAKAALLAAFGYLEELSEVRDLEKLGGLAPYMPATAVSVLVSFLSLAGVPLTLGFWAELEVVAGVVTLLARGSVSGLTAAAALSASTALSLAYGVLCFKRVFFGKPKLRLKEDARSAPVVIALVLSLANVALGAHPGLLIAALQR